jgi:hypothetical protein
LPKYQTDCCKFNLERSTDPKHSGFNLLLRECIKMRN